jgi:hypothetical protein
MSQLTYPVSGRKREEVIPTKASSMGQARNEAMRNMVDNASLANAGQMASNVDSHIADAMGYGVGMAQMGQSQIGTQAGNAGGSRCDQIASGQHDMDRAQMFHVQRNQFGRHT